MYISLIKRALKKNMKEYDCPVDIWDYCVERRARINSMMAKIYFNCTGPTRILNWVSMKVTFPVYVSLSGMISVVFATAINNLL